MTRYRTLRSADPLQRLSMLPFLDIIFSMIGIFIVVFALQEVIRSEAARQPAVDHLLICTDDRELQLYLTPDTTPLNFSRVQLPALFDALAIHSGGIRNLVFAFSRDCFNTQRLFERAFAKFTALARDQANGPKTVFRLAFRPLATDPEALEDLLNTWRGADHASP